MNKLTQLQLERIISETESISETRDWDYEVKWRKLPFRERIQLQEKNEQRIKEIAHEIYNYLYVYDLTNYDK